MGLARLLVVLALALSLACLGVGRKPVGEVHLPADAPDRGAAFSNALYQTVGVRLEGERCAGMHVDCSEIRTSR